MFYSPFGECFIKLKGRGRIKMYKTPLNVVSWDQTTHGKLFELTLDLKVSGEFTTYHSWSDPTHH